MLVVNLAGFNYPIELGGRKMIIPYDNRPHEVPDEFAKHNFGGAFKILVAPKPKLVIEVNNYVKPEPVQVPVDSYTGKPFEEPLKGIKLKKSKRKELHRGSKERDHYKGIKKINTDNKEKVNELPSQ